MVQAKWNGIVVAESDETVVVDGNHYFPRQSLNRALFKNSETTSFCPWKGTAHYYSLEVEGQVNEDAAWFYPDPKKEASEIRNRIAFWNGVTVQ